MNPFPPMKQFAKFSPKLGMLLILISLLITCSVDAPAPISAEQQKPTLINDFISFKWVGTNTIPDFDFFADGGTTQISCFSFTEVMETNVTEYEWKSGIYISNTPPQQAWFYTTTNETDGIELSSLELTEFGDSFFYFILRYNVTNEHLDKYLDKDENGKYYSVQYVLNNIRTKMRDLTDVDGTVVTDVDGKPVKSFKGLSIYMPVLVRNIRTDANGIKRAEMNFATIFEVLPVGEEPNWQDIFKYLERNIGYSIIKDFWTEYYEVNSIEDGAYGCPDF